MQAISLMETLSITPTRDDLYTIHTASQISAVDYADKCLHVCLARAPPATPAIRLSRYLGTNIDFLKAGTTELKFVLAHLRLTASQWWQANKGFCIAVSRTTKATQTTPIAFC